MARRVKAPDIFAMTEEELAAHVKALGERLAEHDARPENRQTGFNLLTPAARRRSSAMGWEIYYATLQLRVLRGEAINTASYTGRNSNRR